MRIAVAAAVAAAVVVLYYLTLSDGFSEALLPFLSKP